VDLLLSFLKKTERGSFVFGDYDKHLHDDIPETDICTHPPFGWDPFQ